VNILFRTWDKTWQDPPFFPGEATFIKLYARREFKVPSQMMIKIEEAIFQKAVNPEAFLSCSNFR
jgi:hypothetical protein